jgi:hydrogenase nickel incorporation protein HypB
MVLNKIDLLPYVPFKMDYFKQGVETLNPGVTLFPVSCRTGEGLKAWFNWVQAGVEEYHAEKATAFD